jgi:hypothetical protein
LKESAKKRNESSPVLPVSTATRPGLEKTGKSSVASSGIKEPLFVTHGFQMALHDLGLPIQAHKLSFPWAILLHGQNV